MTYRNVLPILEASPVKKLACKELWNGDFGCALGECFLPSISGHRDLGRIFGFVSMSPSDPILHSLWFNGQGPEFLARQSGRSQVETSLGLTRREAINLQVYNDQGKDEDPSERYTRVVAWLRKQCAMESGEG